MRLYSTNLLQPKSALREALTKRAHNDLLTHAQETEGPATVSPEIRLASIAGKTGTTVTEMVQSRQALFEDRLWSTLSEKIQRFARQTGGGLNAQAPDIFQAANELADRYLALSAIFPDSGIARLSGAPGEHAVAAAHRARDPRFWRRQIRTHLRRAREMGWYLVGTVCSGQEPYASNETVQEHRSQREAQQAWAEQTVVVPEDGGEPVSMDQILEAKEHKRWAELVTRIRGVADYADSLDLVPGLVTLTAPSRFHPSSAAYDGSSPKDAQEHLSQAWARARARLQRAGVEPVWIRTAEPHQDGCPHWHLVLWAAPADWNQVRGALFRHFLGDDTPEEPGARTHRVRVDAVEGGTEGAVAYVTKYALKHSLGIEEESSTTERIAAWRATWGIRAFQFSQNASAPVTAWRLLRKPDWFGDSFDLQMVREAALAGDWWAFLVQWQQRGLALVSEPRENSYGESTRRPVGVGDRDGVVGMPLRSWRMERKTPKARESGPTGGAYSYS